MKTVPQQSWQIMRLFLVLAAGLGWLSRAIYLWDHYSSAGIVITSGGFALTRWVIWSPEALTFIWFLLVLSLGILLSDRFYKIGAVLYLTCAISLYGAEGLNMKAYDRLMLWQTFVLLFAPRKEGTWSGISVARIMMIMLYSCIYGSTGWLKTLHDFQGWVSGETLSYHLLDTHFGQRPLGLWLLQFPFLVQLLSWFTLIFESLFPFLVWFRSLNPFVLAAGIAFHAGISITMNVGVFFNASIVGYAVMLHPYYSARLKEWLAPFPLDMILISKIIKAGLLLFLIVLFFLPFTVGPDSVIDDSL